MHAPSPHLNRHTQAQRNTHTHTHTQAHTDTHTHTHTHTLISLHSNTQTHKLPDTVVDANGKHMRRVHTKKQAGSSNHASGL